MTVRKKKSTDFNILAASIVKEATGEPIPEKNPAAVALGRLGGLKGGPAKVKKMSKKELSKWGRKAAKVRWNKK